MLSGLPNSWENRSLEGAVVPEWYFREEELVTRPRDKIQQPVKSFGRSYCDESGNERAGLITCESLRYFGKVTFLDNAH